MNLQSTVRCHYDRHTCKTIEGVDLKKNSNDCDINNEHLLLVYPFIPTIQWVAQSPSYTVSTYDCGVFS